MVGIPADIVLSTLSTPPVKGVSTPLVSTHPLKRDGTRGSLVPDAPDFTTSKTSSSITATIVAANGATSYECSINGTDWVAGLTISGLNPEQSYPFQVRGINAHGTGPDSPIANVTTAAAPVGGVAPLFSDDFASGDLSKSVGGFSWGTPAGDVQVTTDNPKTGTHSLAFTYGPNADETDDTAELPYTLSPTPGEGLTEAWFEYDWYVPANYLHRAQTGTEHHKFFAVYSDAQDNGGAQAIFENWRTSDTQSYFRTICYGGDCDVQAYYPDWDNNRPFIIPSILGTWVRIRIHVKVGQGTEGRVEVWRDDEKVYDKQATQWTGVADFWRKGYLMGWSNAGYAEATTFYIDNFKIYDQDPAWAEVPTFTPMVAENFAAGTLGASAAGWKNSEYVDTLAASGGKSLKLSTVPVQPGSCPPSPTQDRFFAGRQALPGVVPKGKIIWQRIACYFPSTFSFGYLYESSHSGDISEADACGITQVDGNSTGTKWLVFAPDVTTARAYANINAQRRNINQADPAFVRISVESGANALTGWTDPLPRDQWVYMQFAIKVADDNTGWARAWINDTLVTELLNVPTVTASDTGIDEYGIGDYWNGFTYTDGQPGRSDFYIDEILVATDADGYGAPTDVDANGNVYIAPTTRVATDGAVVAVEVLEESDFTSAIPAHWFVSSSAQGSVTVQDGYVRGSYPSTVGNGESHANISVPMPAGTTEVYIEARVRMPNAKGGCKFIKVQGLEEVSGNYANTTFGTDYSTGDFMEISYGNGSGVGNDVGTTFQYDGDVFGTVRHDGNFSLLAPQGRIFTATDWGSDWHTFKIFCKFNSGTTAENEVADAEYYVEIDGQVWLHATGFYNRHYSNPGIEKVVLFNWSQGAPSGFDVDFDYVRFTTGGFL